MSMELFREKTVAGRVDHRCDACLTIIKKGEKQSYMTAKWEGDFWAARNHAECRAAEIALANLHDLRGGEEWLFLHDLDDDDDLRWLAAEHPAAWERIGERYAYRFDEAALTEITEIYHRKASS